MKRALSDIERRLSDLEKVLRTQRVPSQTYSALLNL